MENHHEIYRAIEPGHDNPQDPTDVEQNHRYSNHQGEAAIPKPN